MYWMFATATKINGKAGHMSDIMLVCNQFRKVRRTVRPYNAVWADFIGNENSTSTSVELSIRGHWEWFPTKVFRVSIASASDSESTMTKRDLSCRVWKVTLPTCLWMHF